MKLTENEESPCSFCGAKGSKAVAMVTSSDLYICITCLNLGSSLIYSKDSEQIEESSESVWSAISTKILEEVEQERESMGPISHTEDFDAYLSQMKEAQTRVVSRWLSDFRLEELTEWFMTDFGAGGGDHVLYPLCEALKKAGKNDLRRKLIDTAIEVRRECYEFTSKRFKEINQELSGALNLLIEELEKTGEEKQISLLRSELASILKD